MDQSRTLTNQLRKKRRKEQQRKKMIALSVGLGVLIIAALLWYGYPALMHYLSGETRHAADGQPDHTGLPGPVTDDDAGMPTTDDAGTSGNGTGEGLSHEEEAGSPPSDAGSEEPANPADSVDGHESDEIHLAFVGDVLLGNNVERVLQAYGNDYPYREVLSHLTTPDLTIANLETPITERGEPQEKQYVYRSSPDVLPPFVEAGFDLVNLANNHVMDYGQTGLLDTLDYLDEAGVARVGAGRDANEAYKPVYIEKKGIKLAFLGFSRVVPDVSWKAGKDHPGVAETYDYRVPVEAIQAAREEADLVIVLAHWGKEGKEEPVDYQLELARRYIDAGADLIVGSHPHVLQGFEQYGGKWIAYSLGNFIFTTNTNPDTHQTVILNAVCSKQGACELSIIPIYTYYAKPVVMDSDQAATLRDKLTRISFGAVINEDGKIEQIEQE